jgi:serine/threonine protein kinase
MKIEETNRVTYVINPEWPKEKKNEIITAIRSSLEKVINNNQSLQGMFGNRYKKIREIGQGAQGIVYEVKDSQDNDAVKALKKFHQIPIELKDSIKCILKEIELLKRISNKSEYIINYLDTFNTKFRDPDHNEYVIYYVVNTLYEVNKCLKIVKLKHESDIYFLRMVH